MPSADRDHKIGAVVRHDTTGNLLILTNRPADVLKLIWGAVPYNTGTTGVPQRTSVHVTALRSFYTVVDRAPDLACPAAPPDWLECDAADTHGGGGV